MRPTHSRAARARSLAGRPGLAAMVGAAAGALLGAALLLAFLRPAISRPERPPQRPPGAVTVLPEATPDEDAGTRDTRVEAPHMPRTPLHSPPALAPLTRMDEWPPEPTAPERVEEKRFTEALAQLCNVGADSVVRSWYARFILRYARDFGSDPFLLGGLVSANARCEEGRGDALGLAGIVPELYERDLHDGRYVYRTFHDGAWQERALSLERFPFTRAFLSAPESNLYFAAAFLRSWQEQQRGLAIAFPQADHRHYVSHFVWGDRVASNRQEDRILVERRRLLEYYGAREPAAPLSYGSLSLGCPLDGCPRVVTSSLGDSREGGKRAHRGTDFESIEGEPVRAIADGKVLFAGVDLPGAAHRHLPIHAQRSVARSLFGAGGIYVCIEHGPASDGRRLISCSMHLSSSSVEQGRLVRRGDPIGRVGRTGIKESAPHLHLELHAQGSVLAAEKVLRGLALGTPRVSPPRARRRAAGSTPMPSREPSLSR